jgi:hypothetical protein
VAASELPRLLSSGFAGAPPAEEEEEKAPELGEELGGGGLSGVNEGRVSGGADSGYVEGREDGGVSAGAQRNGMSEPGAASKSLEEGSKTSAERKGKANIGAWGPGTGSGPASENGAKPPSKNSNRSERPTISIDESEIRAEDRDPGPSSSGRYAQQGASPALQNSPVWRVLSPVVPPDELFSQVLNGAPKDDSASALYLIAVLIEHVRSLGAVDMRTPPEVYELLVKLLLREGRTGQLVNLLESKVSVCLLVVCV